jgi:hypothetical protein
MTTFNVDPVMPVLPVLSKTRASKKWHEHYLRQELACINIKNVEANKFNFEEDRDFELVQPGINSFLGTALRSYAEHVPLTLSPDDVWVTILQAVAKHITLNAEDARKAIVNFDGKMKLTVFADDFSKGSPVNDWQRVFGQFNDQIELHIGKKRSLFDASFSTTTATERAAIQVQVMAALAPYFDYEVHTRCGIPNITLLGTADDWASIQGRVAALAEFYPLWAQEALMFAVDKFHAAALGNPDLTFWRNFVKYEDGSGGARISGFINAFFPYLDDQPNRVLKQGKDVFIKNVLEGSYAAKVREDTFPGSVTTVPFIWKYFETVFKMKLASGIFGTTVYGAGYRPVIGWVVGEDKEQAE